MRYDEESESERLSLLEAFASLKNAIAYAQRYNSVLVAGDIVLAIPIEYATEALNKAKHVWFVKHDGYATIVPKFKPLLHSLSGESVHRIIDSAIWAGVEHKLIVKCLYDCASQIYAKFAFYDQSVTPKLNLIKRYIDGDISRADLDRRIFHSGWSDFSSSVSSIVDKPSIAAYEFAAMSVIDAVGIIKSHITPRVLLSGTANKARK